MFDNSLSVLNILFQIDQHDFAIKNRSSLAEHGFDLDTPSWPERLAAGAAAPASPAPRFVPIAVPASR